ncbi:MAG TPA: M20 family metallopeptidase [Pyrinomonadaceae bacterium]|jgi:glutamate carboxypeptidase|nr:M20 family metallopeptidase [Pyrinomonadaceae bacterium]
MIELEFSKAMAVAVREHLESRRGEMLALTRSLVETESPSGDLEGSRAVVSLLAEAARKIDGVTSIERIESPDYGEHLRVRAFGDARECSGAILVIGHTDTVHPRGSVGERPWREQEGRIYAPGIFDMKASCALVLEVIRACATLGFAPRHPVVLLLTCDEETGSMTGRALIEEEARASRGVLVLEPPASGGRVKTARKGTGLFTIEAHGIAAHAGLEPEKGASAVLEIARQIERLHAMNESSRGISVNVGVVQGGTRSNVVAAYASAEIDVRFSTTEEAKRLEEKILNVQSFDERVKLSITGGINRPPLERTEKVAALFNLARKVAAMLDFDLGEASVGGASDGNFAAALNVAVLDGLGIDGDGAHATHEHIVVDDIARRGALLAGLINLMSL